MHKLLHAVSSSPATMHNAVAAGAACRPCHDAAETFCMGFWKLPGCRSRAWTCASLSRWAAAASRRPVVFDGCRRATGQEQSEYEPPVSSAQGDAGGSRFTTALRGQLRLSGLCPSGARRSCGRLPSGMSAGSPAALSSRRTGASASSRSS